MITSRSHAAIVIVNPKAGRGDGGSVARRAVDRLTTHGWDAEVLSTSRPGEATALARDESGGASLVVAVGGDGTASEVAEGLMSLDDRPAMAVVPAGSGCDLARNLGIGGIEAGLDALETQAMRNMDLGRIELQGQDGPFSRYFVLTTGTGFSASVIRSATTRVKRLFRSKTYAVAGVLGAFRYRPPMMRWTVDGETGEGRVFNVVVSNAEIEAGGARMSPGATAFDGKLWVAVWHGSSALAGLWRMRLIFGGSHVEHPAITYTAGSVVTIDSDPPVGIQVDGEVPGRTPARFEVVPGVLRVVVGQAPGLTRCP